MSLTKSFSQDSYMFIQSLELMIVCNCSISSLPALFLILHSLFLGINFGSDIFKFFRRFVLLGFIIFEIIAQALLVLNIVKYKTKLQGLINNKILIFKIILVSILALVAILSLPILNSSEYTHFKHALEWNYFLGVVSFYLLTFLFWKKQKPSVHTP